MDGVKPYRTRLWDKTGDAYGQYDKPFVLLVLGADVAFGTIRRLGGRITAKVRAQLNSRSARVVSKIKSS